MARLLTLLTLAALETTVVSLPILALTSFGLPWPLLFLVLLVGVAVDAVSLRLAPQYERPALAGGAALAVLLLLAQQLGGPLAGLGAVLPGSERLGLAYSLTLIALFLFWRGSRVAAHDSLGVNALFGRGAMAILLTLIVGPILGIGAPLGSAPVLAHIVGFVSLSLLALALTHAADDPAADARRLGWRWVATLAISIGAVVLIGILALALFGGGAAVAAAQSLLLLLLFPVALIGGLIAYLLVTFVAAPLAALLRLILARMSMLGITIPQGSQIIGVDQDQGPLESVVRFANGATFLMALIPLVILVLVILLVRGRQSKARADDEERESLGVAANLASDLRDLLGRLRNPFARNLAGLRAALAALHGDDPATRVRRAYVRFLLQLEERARPRAPAQTPAELAASLDTPQALAALTASYEQARYNPAGVGPAEAAAAEQAVEAIKGT